MIKKNPEIMLMLGIFFIPETMSLWFCDAKSSLLFSFAGLSLDCSVNMRSKVWIYHEFTGQICGSKLQRKLWEQCRPNPAKLKSNTNSPPQNHRDVVS